MGIVDTLYWTLGPGQTLVFPVSLLPEVGRGIDPIQIAGLPHPVAEPTHQTAQGEAAPKDPTRPGDVGELAWIRRYETEIIPSVFPLRSNGDEKGKAGSR